MVVPFVYEKNCIKIFVLKMQNTYKMPIKLNTRRSNYRIISIKFNSFK